MNSLLAINYYCSRPLLINNTTRLSGARFKARRILLLHGKKGRVNGLALKGSAFNNAPKTFCSSLFRSVKNSESIAVSVIIADPIGIFKSLAIIGIEIGDVAASL